MKTIIVSLLKLLYVMMLRKLWPFHREAVLKLPLEQMTPEQIVQIRNYLWDISTPPPAVKICHHKPREVDFMNAYMDLCAAIKYLNNYIWFSRIPESASPLVAVRQKISVYLSMLL